jgi:uroporphyrinogen III methyltransferase/synthase
VALAGRRILITRAEHQAKELAEAIEALGGQPLYLPGLAIEPPQSYAPLDEALSRLAQFDWLVFTSQNAVEAFAARRRGSALKARIAAVGPKTARALTNYGMTADLVAEAAVAESLADALAREVRGKRVLLPRAEDARELLPNELRRAGASEVCVVPAYRAVPAQSAAYESVAASLTSGKIDAVTFASARTVGAVLSRLKEVLGERTVELLARCRIFSIGPWTTRACRAVGISLVTEANPHTLEGLVDAMVREIGR